MKKLLYSLLVLVGLIIVLAGSGTWYVSNQLPNIPLDENFRVVSTPELIERGDYLANHVTLCLDCHSERDWNYFAAPPKAGTEGAGGDSVGPEHGLPGTVYASNITPASLGDWSDAELARAITSGVSKDGSALFPMMPYKLYNNLSTEDLSAIIAYLRTIEPIKNDIPPRTLDFPLDLIVNTMPITYTPQTAPMPADSVAYGEYLASVGGCMHCHTQVDGQGQYIPGTEFAGGQAFKIPDVGTTQSANISPDEATGIGTWSRSQFIARFKAFAPENLNLTPVEPGQPLTMMPWAMYVDMTEADLASIYAYLQTVAPVKNKVQTWIPE